MTTRNLLFGLLFGFVLSRVGATDYDAIAGMFRLADLHLMGVIGGAVALSAFGFWLIRRRALRSLDGTPIELVKKPMTRWLPLGAVMFGVGWALTGTCPGTALAQLGEGRFAALATIAGILLGSYVVEERATRRKSASTSEPHCAEMERHVDACPCCKGACDSLKRTLSLCVATPAAHIPASVQASVKVALKNFLAGKA